MSRYYVCFNAITPYQIVVDAPDPAVAEQAAEAYLDEYCSHGLYPIDQSSFVDFEVFKDADASTYLQDFPVIKADDYEPAPRVGNGCTEHLPALWLRQTRAAQSGRILDL